MDALALGLTQNNTIAAASPGADGAPPESDGTGVNFATLVATLRLNNSQTNLESLENPQTRHLATDYPSGAQPGTEAFVPLAALGLNIPQMNPRILVDSASDSTVTGDLPDSPPSVNTLDVLHRAAPAALPITTAREPFTSDALNTVADAQHTTAAQTSTIPRTLVDTQAQSTRAAEPASPEQVAPHLRAENDNGASATATIADGAANIAADGTALHLAARPASVTTDLPADEAPGLDRIHFSSVEGVHKHETMANTLLPQPAESRPPSPQPSALLDVAAPVHEPGFADALSRQVVWMVGKDAQVAELRLDPPDLGPVHVRLTLNGGDAVAHFSAAHADVREAIENAIARLRETLAQTGIQLGDTSVSAESFADQAGRHADAHWLHHNQSYRDQEARGDAAWQTLPSTTVAKRGLVDIFA